MTDQPEFRLWADSAHKDSLKILKNGKHRGHFPCPNCKGTDFKRFGLLQSHRTKKHSKP